MRSLVQLGQNSAVLAVLVIAALDSTRLGAQVIAEAVPPRHAGPTSVPHKDGCEILISLKAARAPKVGEPVELLAHCGNAVLPLGRADQYVVVDRPSVGAAAAFVKSNGQVRVLVVSSKADGGPMVEDYVRPLAKAVGLNPDGDLAELEVDFSNFNASGRIVAQARGRGRTELSIDEAIAAEVRRRLALDAAQ